MNLQDLPKGPGGGEMNDLAGRKAMNQAGVYTHPGANKTVIVMPDSKSTAQQDALVRMGYEWVGAPPTRLELLQMQKDQAKKDAEAEASGVVNESHLTTPDPDAPKFNGTATDTSADAKLLSEALARAEAAEAKVRELQDGQLAGESDPTPAQTESNGGSEEGQTQEGNGNPLVPENQTNENQGS